MERRYLNVCKQLVELGYKYTLKPDSLLLVERLLADLVQTTESLRKYMRIAQEAVEERDNLKFGAEPYKCDNAKLVKECNELHSASLQLKEQNEKQQKELRKQITSLEKEKRDLADNQKKLRERVRELELNEVRKTDRRLQNQLRQSGKAKSTSVLLKPDVPSARFKINSAMALADEKIANLMKEVCKLKQAELELADINCELKAKLNVREKEIKRLMAMLEGGRPANAVNGDCCYQDINVKLLDKQDEINFLQKNKIDMDAKLKEARCRQHEAMKHALQLAERNSLLEKELKDIDEMALAVEQECNETVKCNSKKVKRLQERMQNTMSELQRMENEVAALRRNKQSLMADLEAVKIEKRHLQSVLETALEDKKYLTDKINKFTIIEKDLNNEIDRLIRDSTEQKRTIAELKGRVISENANFCPGDEFSQKHQPTEKFSCKTLKACSSNCSPTRKSPSPPAKRKTKHTKKAASSKKTIEAYKRNEDLYNDGYVPNNTPTSCNRIAAPEICDPELCVQKLRQMVEEEMNKRYPNKTNSLERLRNERDFYIKEYQQLIGHCRNICGKPEDTSQLMKKLNEKEDLIISLQHENQTLGKEKHNLMSRLENVRDYNDNGDCSAMKSSLKRLERERDILKADVDRLQEERDCAKQQLKVATELRNSEIGQYQRTQADLESQIRRSEIERQDLLQSQGSRRATFTCLEDQCGTLREQLKSTQAELMQQRTIYSQLKILHEQTDRALADSQGQLMQLEKELSNHQKKGDVYDTNTTTLKKEISSLRHDSTVLKQTLTEMDKEKDSLLITLDSKTERIAMLENEMKKRDSKIEDLERNMGELRTTVSSTVEERIAKEYLLQNSATEMMSVKTELQNALKAKEAALLENKRLQEDLTACTVDSRRANGDLDIAKRQIDDLKRQLQHYVAEVKRIEDLMTSKEVERSEMLDQFRNLSHEAIVLETNNHSLEHEATQTKVQLSVALDHANSLEQQLEEQTGLIRTYEKQVAEMTSLIATLEIQSKHHRMEKEHVENDLVTVQDLCAKLDRQREELQRQLKDEEGLKMMMERDIKKVKRESETLQQSREKEHNTVESLEILLADNRQKVVEQRLLNDDLQHEILRLKNHVKDLETNLSYYKKTKSSKTVRVSKSGDNMKLYENSYVRNSFGINRLSGLTENGEKQQEIRKDENLKRDNENYVFKDEDDSFEEERGERSPKISIISGDFHNYPEKRLRGSKVKFNRRASPDNSKNSKKKVGSKDSQLVAALRDCIRQSALRNVRDSQTAPDVQSYTRNGVQSTDYRKDEESMDKYTKLIQEEDTNKYLDNVLRNGQHASHPSKYSADKIELGQSIVQPKSTFNRVFIGTPPPHPVIPMGRPNLSEIPYISPPFAHANTSRSVNVKEQPKKTDKARPKSAPRSENSDPCDLIKMINRERCPRCQGSSYNFNLSFIRQLQNYCSCKELGESRGTSVNSETMLKETTSDS